MAHELDQRMNGTRASDILGVGLDFQPEVVGYERGAWPPPYEEKKPEGTKMKFFIEQIALCPQNPERAIELLTQLGLGDWVKDHVVAEGRVYGVGGRNEADLAFNYENTRPEGKPLELEVLHYTRGPNWMAAHGAAVSHLGMHCTAEELDVFRRKFADMGYKVAQEVFTESHTNPFLVESGRKYQYVIFDTRRVLGVDLKFIVRREKAAE